jgi:hypothetical protein
METRLLPPTFVGLFAHESYISHPNKYMKTSRFSWASLNLKSSIRWPTRMAIGGQTWFLLKTALTRKSSGAASTTFAPSYLFWRGSRRITGWTCQLMFSGAYWTGSKANSFSCARLGGCSIVIELQSVSPISAMDPSFNRLGRSSIRRI